MRRLKYHYYPVPLSKKLSAAIVLHRNGNICEAISVYKSLLIEESNPELYFRLGTAYYQLNKFQSSIKWLEKSLEYTERYSIRFNLGLAYKQVGDYDAAKYHLSKSLRLPDAKPESAVALLDLYRRTHRNDDAEKFIIECVSRWPESVQLLLLAGEIYREGHRYDDAKHCLKRAVACDGVHYDVFYNLAMLEKQCGDYGDAEQHFLRYHELTNNNEGILQIAQIYLLQERYAEAWPLYSKRIAGRGGVEFNLQELNASVSTLCIMAEQGVGDELFFSRLLWKVRRDFPAIYYECDPRLVELFQKIYPFVTFVEKGGMPKVKGACVVYAGDLPEIYVRSSLDISQMNFPMASKIQSMAGDIISSNLENIDRPLIGVSLFTRSEQKDYRVPDIAVWDRLLKRGDCSFVNLQAGYDDMHAHLSSTVRKKIHNVQGCDLYNDFVVLSELIQRMDCVLTVDNYIAHLCGLLGVQCVVLLPYTPDWRWIDKDGKSLWYPSVFVAKQTEPYQWGGVVSMVELIQAKIVARP